jgi:flagellar M-ring protein FliF
MEFLRQLRRQLQTIYAGMSRLQRIGLAGLVAACLAGVGLVVYLNQPEYHVLFSGLAVEDVGAVTAKLQAKGVAYKLGAGGTSVLVPSGQVGQLRVDLAAEGLPAKAKGFELFDEINIGMTPFQQHVNFDRALQAELARTITEVDPITFARVHLVRPDPTPFVRDQKPATASVVLKLRPGATLSRKTAAGITALVARSVEGLAADQVTLLDTSGRVLTEAKEGEFGGPVASQLDYRREMEAYLSSRAEDMLARVLGPSRAVVRVTADVNYQHQKTKRETYDPEQRVLVKETITNKKTASTTPGARGAAGAGSNLPGVGKAAAAAPPAPGPTNNENEENTDSEWRATKVEQELEEGRGTVERLTVACLIDLSGAAEGGAGKALTLPEAEEIVKQAVGFKKGRDEIKVSDVKLASMAPPETPPTVSLDTDGWARYMALARNASLGVTALVGLTLAVLYYRRRRPVTKAEEPPAEQEDPGARLGRLAAENPDVLARVLAAWIDGPAPEPAAVPAARAA